MQALQTERSRTQRSQTAFADRVRRPRSQTAFADRVRRPNAALQTERLRTLRSQTEQFANADRRMRERSICKKKCANVVFAKKKKKSICRPNVRKRSVRKHAFANADRTFANVAFADRTFANAAFADRYSIVSVVQFISPANDKRAVGECSVR